MSIESPLAGTKYTRGAKIPVTVTATDDGAIVNVRLIWKSPIGDVSYTLESLGGGKYGIDLDLSWSAVAGPRTLRIGATDDAGNTTTAPDRVIEVLP